jgi:hypothetical protein
MTGSRTTTRRQTREERDAELAGMIFPFIPTIEERRRVSVATLRYLTDIRRDREIQRGVAWLREHVPQWPLLSNSQGYAFSVDRDELTAFLRQRIRCMATYAFRTQAGAVQPYLRYADNLASVERLSRHLVMLQQDIADVLADTEQVAASGRTR